MAQTSRTTPTKSRPARPAAAPKRPAKAAPKKAAPVVEDEVVEEEPTFHFDIAQAEKEREEDEADLEPFRVRLLSGEIVTMKSPESIGWQQTGQLTLRDPYAMLATIMEDGDLEKFIEQGDFSIKTMNLMGQAWFDYHGIVPQGN